MDTRLTAMRQYFESGVTRSREFRLLQLKKLQQAILSYETELHLALYTDLQKSSEESWVTETGFVLAEIRHTRKQLQRWMKPERVSTNLLNLPSASYILREPLGVVLIVSPWNYPFQLLFAPLLGSLAAGNCVVLKPSELAPATSAVMKKIIREIFSPEYVLYVEGNGAVVIPALMQDFRFDHIFYTGSTAVGKEIYCAAARQLIPVTLELGGKSPCVIEQDANIAVAARRIATPKFSNTGQMCIAPDYLLVHSSIKHQLVEALKKAIRSFYSDDAAKGYGYGKIINEKQFQRLVNYLPDTHILYGGRYDSSKLYIEPTLLEPLRSDAPIMQEEIFGPLLPILTFNAPEEAAAIIHQHPNPLAFYLFTESRSTEKNWLEKIPFGGGCVNNAGWHVTNPHLPFGGRGASGIGQYHGKYSFDTFSHKKSVMKTPTWFDPSIKYPPLQGKMKLLKWFIR